METAKQIKKLFAAKEAEYQRLFKELQKQLEESGPMPKLTLGNVRNGVVAYVSSGYTHLSLPFDYAPKWVNNHECLLPIPPKLVEELGKKVFLQITTDKRGYINSMRLETKPVDGVSFYSPHTGGNICLGTAWQDEFKKFDPKNLVPNALKLRDRIQQVLSVVTAGYSLRIDKEAREYAKKHPEKKVGKKLWRTYDG